MFIVLLLKNEVIDSNYCSVKRTIHEDTKMTNATINVWLMIGGLRSGFCFPSAGSSKAKIRTRTCAASVFLVKKALFVLFFHYVKLSIQVHCLFWGCTYARAAPRRAVRAVSASFSCCSRRRVSISSCFIRWHSRRRKDAILKKDHRRRRLSTPSRPLSWQP